MGRYSQAYYDWLRGRSRESARQIVPFIVEALQPKSVLDAGCGTGTWLAAFRECGVADCFGVDGAHIPPSMIEIPPDQFMAADLTDPPELGRRFDLAIALEVAEHLPETAADRFVRWLTRAAPLVVFSAAIPGQGGEGHVNEQWPDYWWRRFRDYGFVGIDYLRRRFWSNPHVDWWYAQNAFLFVERSSLVSYPGLAAAHDGEGKSLALVHPRNYLQRDWNCKALAAALDLTDVLRPGSRFLLIDDGKLGETAWHSGRQAIPFPEREGIFAGPPADEEVLFRELSRACRSSVQYIVIAWPAFWWLDYYQKFAASLRSQGREILSNERVIVFHLPQEVLAT